MMYKWPPRYYELKKIFMPYWKPPIGVPDDAPQEAKDAFEECRKIAEKAACQYVEY